MNQTFTRYVVQRDDGQFWWGGRNEFFSEKLINATFYKTAKMAKQQLESNWWYEKTKDKYSVKEVIINYEVKQ